MLEPANDLVQWGLYYPAVINVEELEFTSEEKRAFGDSLNAYRAGDLLSAMASYPGRRHPPPVQPGFIPAELLLSVGQVEKSQALLSTIQDSPHARALRLMIAVVKAEKWPHTNQPASASEWMAASYALQSANEIGGALDAASAATTNAPNFGFAWARVAELEFSSGHIGKGVHSPG